MKAIAITEPTHNPIEQTYWASGLRENFTSRSYGEGLETGRKVPRQSLTRHFDPLQRGRECHAIRSRVQAGSQIDHAVAAVCDG